MAGTGTPGRGCEDEDTSLVTTGTEDGLRPEGGDEDDCCTAGTDTPGRGCEDADTLYPGAVPMSEGELIIAGGTGLDTGIDVDEDAKALGRLIIAAAKTASTDPVRAATRMASSWDDDITTSGEGAVWVKLET